MATKKGKKYHVKSGLQKESKRKIFMRVMTFVIALITIAGLVFIFPFEFAASAEGLPTDVVMTEQGAGMFTVKNALLILSGFAVGFILGEIFRAVHKHRDAKEKAAEKSGK
jgi:ABC-type uncharacterized transport system permease subunit